MKNEKKILTKNYQKKIYEQNLRFSQKESKFQNYVNKTIQELNEKERKLKNDFELKDKLFEEKTIGFPWIAEQYGYLKSAHLEEIEKTLRLKQNPAIKAADAIRIARHDLKEAEQKYFISQGVLNYYESLFPWLKEFYGADDDFINSISSSSHDDIESDPASKYISPLDWHNLPTQQKFQLALDKYWERKKSKLEIGRIYERFIGYEYEIQGWEVTYFGAIKGFEDLGRDLIAKRKSEIHIVQCKNWASEKNIHEKHIFQLFGTCILFELENDLSQNTNNEDLPLLTLLKKQSLQGVFVASCNLSEVARMCAERLGIIVHENKKLERFPSIKCVIRDNEKIYHLPFDQQYDRIKMQLNKGDFYCETIKEAENAGFRRAFRWHGNS